MQLTSIQSKIYELRGQRVMLDFDLAEMYGVETRVLNQAVKRNIERFPVEFSFQLMVAELQNLKSQFVISSWGGTRYIPYAFTEQGVAMLSAVLRSEMAVKVSIQIMKAFVDMRKLLLVGDSLTQRIGALEQMQIANDQKFEQVFRALEQGQPEAERGIFFEGQIFDAYVFVSDLIKKAQKRIIVIDNYLDERVLLLLSKRVAGVSALLCTGKITDTFKLDLEKHNQQYAEVEFKKVSDFHDRFLIIDNEVYHFGASLKDLGNKVFAFQKMEGFANEIINKVKCN